MLVTLRSLVLLESRCAECYADDLATPQHGLCCDGDSMELECPSSCDVFLIFCSLKVDSESLTKTLNPYNEPPLGTNCSQLDPVVGDWLGNNSNTNEVYQYNSTGPIGLFGALSNPVMYVASGKRVRG